MGGLYFLLPTLLVIFISFLIVRAAAVALSMTGMDDKKARFQALSAFTGTGFTTREAESVMNHSLRRQIVSLLMLLGYAGFVTIIISATSSIVNSQGYHLPVNVFILLIGIYLIHKIATRGGFTRRWEKYIKNKLMKSAAFEEGVTEDLLHLGEGYGMVRASIKEDSPFAGTILSDRKFREKGLLVLGFERGKNWIPIPKASEEVKAGDNLVVYGPLNTLREVFKRGAL